jgi:hypothetical protein
VTILAGESILEEFPDFGVNGFRKRKGGAKCLMLVQIKIGDVRAERA